MSIEKIFGKKAKYKVKEFEQGWICTCGRYNTCEASRCSLCENIKENLFAMCSEDGMNEIIEKYNNIREELKRQLERYEILCGELGEKESDVALAWLLQREGVAAPIMGIRTLEQLESAIHALDSHLEADFLAELDKIFLGYGSVPEYYAW